MAISFSDLGNLGGMDHAGDGHEPAITQKFRVYRKIGSGGMGNIYVAQERMSCRFVALKVAKSNAGTSTVHQFIREAIMTSRLAHPNIIPVYEVGSISEPFYSMHLVNGSDYARCRNYMNLHQRIRALCEAARGVRYAHRQGLWHRDLKPANIMLTGNRHVHVIDWGMVSVQPGCDYAVEIPSVLLGRESRASLVADKLIEQTGQAFTTTHCPGGVGTPAYMAPEQHNDDHAAMGVVSDVWAFGVMLFEAVAQSHPAGSLSRMKRSDLAKLVTSQDYPELKSVRRNVPPQINRLCTCMLHRRPKRRMSNLSEFIEGLADFEDVPSARWLSAQWSRVLAGALYLWRPRRPAECAEPTLRGDRLIGTTPSRRPGQGEFGEHGYTLHPRS